VGGFLSGGGPGMSGGASAPASRGGSFSGFRGRASAAGGLASVETETRRAAWATAGPDGKARHLLQSRRARSRRTLPPSPGWAVAAFPLCRT
jgi:hypothetical protein